VLVVGWLVDASDNYSLEYQRQINQLKSALQLESEMAQKSTVIQMWRRYQKIINKVLPWGSRRRRLYELPISAFRLILVKDGGNLKRKAIKT
jgi:hypothetical protein